MKDKVGIICHAGIGKTTVAGLIEAKAIELQNEVVVLEEKNKLQFDREITIPIKPIPDGMVMHEEPKFIDLKPFYHRFSKNHKKVRR